MCVMQFHKSPPWVPFCLVESMNDLSMETKFKVNLFADDANLICQVIMLKS